jgi:hypothetical protein
MTNIIKQYQIIKQNIPLLLDKSGYRNDYIAKQMGMKPAHFATKKKRANWSDTEVEKIITVLTSQNKVVEDIIDRIVFSGLSKGETISSKEFEKLMGW